MDSPAEAIKGYIGNIRDWPKKGIIFRDITPLMRSAEGLKIALDHLLESCSGMKVDAVAGIEARGFLLASFLAYRMGAGTVMVRKKGKLPGKTLTREYQLEYGSATIEIQKGSISPGDRILIVDDLLATGGTVLATADLVAEAGGIVEACRFIVNLPDIGGGDKLKQHGLDWAALVEFEGE